LGLVDALVAADVLASQVAEAIMHYFVAWLDVNEYHFSSLVHAILSWWHRSIKHSSKVPSSPSITYAHENSASNEINKYFINIFGNVVFQSDWVSAAAAALVPWRASNVSLLH
jgi:hypothetical protein